MALHVIENNLKTICDQIYVKSMQKIDKINNETIFLCHFNNSTKKKFLISLCNSEIWNYFDGLDSCYPPINDWEFGYTQIFIFCIHFVFYTYASLKVYQWLQIGNFMLSTNKWLKIWLNPTFFQSNFSFLIHMQA